MQVADRSCASRIRVPSRASPQSTASTSAAIHKRSSATSTSSQRFDLTNNFIHDNTCADDSLAGAGFSLANVSGTIKGNVIRKNACGRGGAGFLNDGKNENTVSIENNLVDGNSGTQSDSAHGGGLYVFGNTLKIIGNEIINNTVTQWGGGLYIGAFTPGNQPTTATLAWNVYRGNRAGDAGGGFFCDDSATCIASHEIYEANCGGNILVDGAGSEGSGPTTTRFDHITNVGALNAACDAPGEGLLVDNSNAFAPDSHAFTNSIFWGNAEGRDFVVACASGCAQLKVTVNNTMVQTKYGDGSVKIAFGAGTIIPADPLFVAPGNHDFRLKAGSPALGKGGTNLGAYGGGDTAPAAVSNASPPSAPVAATAPPAPVAQTRPAATPPAEPRNAAPTASDDVSEKDAFGAAKDLGTIAGWNAFLARYPSGFLSDLARAYVRKLGGSSPDAIAKPANAPDAKPASVPAPAAKGASPVVLGANASLSGTRLLPDDSPWHRDISQDAIDKNSGRILARIGFDKPLRADFGPEYEGAPMGIPYVVIAKDQPKVPVTFTYAEESDAGPYPIPPDAPIEGGPQGTGDRHIISLDRESRMLWELFNAFPDGKGGWKADSGAVWDLSKNQVRPATWTSADAAGLPILPGLVRYDEVFDKGAIEHALRFTLSKSRRAYVPPASHWASKLTDDDLPPMGMRVRLKADFDISKAAPEVRVILTALKKYGMILADNGGDNFISGAPDARWNVDTLRGLMAVTTKDLEVVEMTDMVIANR